jgi:hypothetical protein
MSPRSFVPVAALLWLSGCTSSFAIQRSDPTFTAAQARLVRAAKWVDAAQPSEPERTLFLQAEAFYNYRFGYPRRGVLGYLAQAAAAVTDLPALQSLAGSLDLIDLRLRAYDGAVHLWESLLLQYPDGALRPLALYRLGWAYRSAGAEGLPRANGDEAFDLLIREHPDSPLAGWSKEAKTIAWKSKSKATAWSIVPGLGQMYVGEYGNGAVRLIVALGSAAMVLAPTALAIERREELSWGRDWPLLLTGVVGLIGLSFDYTAAYQDALRGVVRFNEVREQEFARRHPEAP